MTNNSTYTAIFINYICVVYELGPNYDHLIKSKNTAQGKWISHKLREGIQLMKYDDCLKDTIEFTVDETVVQYFFCLEGSMIFNFHNGSYQMPLNRGENCFFYNPNQKLSPKIDIRKESKVVFIFCSLEKIHQLFLDGESELEFLKTENVNRKFYMKDVISSELEFVLRQIIESNKEGKIEDIFRYAKVLEVLSLYFSRQAREDKTSCPYIKDEESVQKIKLAKDILIDNMQNPPTTTQLAERVDINEHRLKEGFKSLYGSTLFQYLLDYKMNTGKRLLNTGNYKIKEVAYELGYNNPSHFITAFKNKFGITPKKYIQAR